MDIYTIMSIKPHNPHYLKKYITFIEQCKHKNENYGGVIENHHACPKSIFPEYSCFKLNSWNNIKLTPRQHFIAHLILAKVFYTNEMKNALYFMSNGKWKKYKKYSKIYEKIRIELKHTWIENGKNFGKNSKDKVVVKDKEGNILKVSSDDQKFKNGEFVGINKGMTTVIDTAGNTFLVSINDHRFLSGELTGIAKNKTIVKDKEGNIFQVHIDEYRKNKEYLHINKGMMAAKDSDGNIHHVSVNDIRLKTGEFSSIMSGKTIVKDNFGNIFLTTTDDIRFKTGEIFGAQKNKVTVKDSNGLKIRIHIDDPRYISGELEHINKGMKAPNKNKVCYTNGVKNIYIKDGDIIPDGFYKGNKSKGKSLEKNILCPHCGFSSGSILNMKRWHMDNCKNKT